MQAHRPSGEMNSGALGALLLVTLAAGLAVGGLVHWIGGYFRPILLLPAGMGFAAGLAVAAVVERKAVRAPRIALAAGVAAALLAWGTDLGASYLSVRAEAARIVDDFAAGFEPPPSPAQRRAAVDVALSRWSGGRDVEADELARILDGAAPPDDAARGILGTFPAWLRGVAREGMTITRSGEDAVNLGEVGTWVLWLIELLVACALAGWLPAKVAAGPFCDPCRRWYGSPDEDVVLAGDEILGPLLRALDADDVAGVVKCAGPTPAPRRLVLRAARCPGCEEAPRYVTLVKREPNGRGHQTFAKGFMTPETWQAIVRGVTEQEAASAPAEAPPAA